MKVKFNKQVTVDFHDARSSEIVDKTFYRNEVVEVGSTEHNTRNFDNLHFLNGDLAIDVPSSAFAVIG